MTGDEIVMTGADSS